MIRFDLIMLQLILSWADFLDLVQKPLHSLWFILLICILVSTLSTLLNKKLVDHDKAKRITEEVKKHNAQKKKLLELAESNPSRYKREYKKWKRRDDSVKKMQQSMTFERLKPTCLTFIPFIAFFYVIRAIYTPEGYIMQIPVARPPMNPMSLPAFLTNILRSELFSVLGNITVGMGFLGYSGYYMLCSFTVGTLIQRLFGVAQTTQSGATGGGLFDSTAQMQLPDPNTL